MLIMQVLSIASVMCEGRPAFLGPCHSRFPTVSFLFAKKKSEVYISVSFQFYPALSCVLLLCFYIVSLIQLLYKKQSNTHYEYTLFSECANHYMFRPILRPSSGVYHNTLHIFVS
jgi:hypothetical protein